MEYLLSFDAVTGDAATPIIRAKAVFTDGSDIPFPLSDEFDVLDGVGSDFISGKKIVITKKKLASDKKSVEFSFSITDKMTSQDLLRTASFKIKVLLYPQYGASMPGVMMPGLGGIVKGAPLGVSECSVNIKKPVKLVVKPEKELVLDSLNKKPVRYTAENQVLNPSKKLWENFNSKDYDIEVTLNRSGDSGNAVTMKVVNSSSAASCKRDFDFNLSEEVHGSSETIEVGSVDARCIFLGRILETVTIEVKAVTQNYAATLEISKPSWQKKSIDLIKALGHEKYQQLRTNGGRLSVNVNGTYKHSKLNYVSKVSDVIATVIIGSSIYSGKYNDERKTLDFEIKPLSETGNAAPVNAELPQPVILDIDKPISEIFSNILNITEKADTEVKNAAVKYICQCLDYFALKDRSYLDINLEGIVKRLSVIENYSRLLCAFMGNVKDTVSLREAYVWRLTENLISFALECASFCYDAFETNKIMKAGKSQAKITGESIAATESRKIIKKISDNNSILLKNAADQVAKKEAACAEMLLTMDKMKESILDAKYWFGKGKNKELTRNGMKLNKKITEHKNALIKLSDELSKAKAEEAVKQNFDIMLKTDLLLSETLTAEEMLQKITDWSGKNARVFLPQKFDQIIHEERKHLLKYKYAGKLKDLSAAIDGWVSSAGTDEILKDIKEQIEKSIVEIEKEFLVEENYELAYEAMKALAINIAKELGGEKQFDLTKTSMETKMSKQVKETEGFMSSSTYNSKSSEPFNGMTLGFVQGVDPLTGSLLIKNTPDMHDDDGAQAIQLLMSGMFSAIKLFGTLILEIITGMGKILKFIADYTADHTRTTKWLSDEQRATGKKKAIEMGLNSNYFQSFEDQKKSMLSMLSSIDNGDTTYVPRVDRNTLPQVKQSVLDSKKQSTRDYFQSSELDTKTWITQAFLVAFDTDKITDYENLGDDEKFTDLLDIFSVLTEPLNRYKNALILSNAGFCGWARNCTDYENWTWTLLDDFLGFFDLVISNMLKLILSIVSTTGVLSFFGGIELLTISSVVDFIVNAARVAVVSGLVIPYLNGLQTDFTAAIGLAYAALFENTDPKS